MLEYLRFKLPYYSNSNSQNMKLFSSIFFTAVLLTSCGSSSSGDSDSAGASAYECTHTNQIEELFFDDADQTFEIKNVFGSHYKGMSYRVIFTNYEGDKYKSASALEGNEMNIVVGLLAPDPTKDFIPGDYTTKGNADGLLKHACQIERAGKNVYCVVRDGDGGIVHIDHADEHSICGTVNVKCSDLKIKGSFSAQNID